MTHEATPDEAPASRRLPWPGLLIAWLGVCAVLIAAHLTAIRAFTFPDPDDALRLLEVRDWLSGQGCYDVHQYRMNLPQGGDMHWSRLVDLPIAGVILLLRPLLGSAGAELAALVAVPLLTLGAAMLLAAMLCRRLMDRSQAVLGALVVPLSSAVTYQMVPMRIDHHGWQIVCAAGIALSLLGSDRWRSGAVAGILAALWLSISLEGLPFAAAVFALLGIRWILDPQEGPRFVAAAAAMAAGSLLFFALTRDPAGWTREHCDAVSPAHLTALAIVALGSAALLWAPFPATAAKERNGLAARTAALALIAGGALAAMRLLAPACGGDPFAQLDPVVYDYWYRNVAEGLPAWRQNWGNACVIYPFPLVGLLGSTFALRASAGADRRMWATMLFLLGAATVTALLVVRAGSAANLLAIPGAIWLFRKVAEKAHASTSLALKIGLTVAALLLLVPGQTIVVAGVALQSEEAGAATATAAAATQLCPTRDELLVLNALPPATMATPLDIAPTVLASTHHRVIASGHHRNSAAMADVIRIFTLPPERALPILRRRGARYVLVCPGMPEAGIFAERNPDGLWSRIAHGHTPAWLEPVPLPGPRSYHLWRVRDAANPANAAAGSGGDRH